MRKDTLLASAARFAGPLIKVGGPDYRVIHAYENADHFTRALAERYPDQTVTVVIQVTYVDREHRGEMDYVDVEVYDGPFTWGGSVGKDVDVGGRAETRLPTERELLEFRRRYGAIGARASVRSTVLRPIGDGVDGRPAQHLYGEA